MNTKRWVAVGVFIGLLFIQLLSNTAIQSNDISSSAGGVTWSTKYYKTGTSGAIALLDINGIIQETSEVSMFSGETYKHSVFLDQLEYAFSSADIDGIVLRVNSPGGGVYESDEIYNKIISLKEEYDKPFVVYMTQLAASGGYYVSAPADKIYANRNTITGSIGVALGGLNMKELMDKIGIKDTTITSGKNKTIMSSTHEMTDEQKRILQSMVDEYYDQFLDVVSQGRNIDKNELKPIADGRIYTARQAKEVGLIDEIGELDDAINEVAGMAGLSDPKVLQFTHSDFGFLSIFLNKAANVFSSKDSINLESAGKLADIKSSLPMYLWEQ